LSKKKTKVEKVGVTLPAEMFSWLDEKGENYIVQIELPGAEKKDIALTMHEDLVSVRADSRPFNATFIGNLHFPLKVDPKKAEATFKEGLLSMHIPVKEKRSPPTSIEIK
jgi:HSP20 family molecular chaperone IbpA